MNPTVVAAWIAAGVSVLTLVGTLAAQYFGRRATSRELDRTLAEQRTQTWNERFATAAEQLGSDKPAVRLAGVYAMAGLADDWEANRQTCVDVLCAYLQLPYEPDPGQGAAEPQRLAFQAGQKVRHTVIRVITAHLKDGAAVSWQGLNLDFTGVVFDGGSFAQARFSGGQVDFVSAEFSGGTVHFGDAQFSGATVSFFSVKFSAGKVNFDGAEFSGGVVNFSSAEFSGGEITFNAAKFSGGSVYFVSIKFIDGFIKFDYAEFSGGVVSFSGSHFAGGTVIFSDARFDRGSVNFNGAAFSGGTVDFNRAGFSGGTVDFNRAGFSGGTVDFNRAGFSGGTVDFSRVRDWSVPPRFPWTGMSPQGVTLPGAGQANSTNA
jgi:uncharacterized protein YjbI with pentapeptide repeats